MGVCATKVAITGAVGGCPDGALGHSQNDVRDPGVCVLFDRFLVCCLRGRSPTRPPPISCAGHREICMLNHDGDEEVRDHPGRLEWDTRTTKRVPEPRQEHAVV